MNIKKICNWINELADEKPTIFGEFFYDDIRNYLNLDECDEEDLELNLKEICGPKFQELADCETKEDVKEWLNIVSGKIVLDLDTDSIIHKYFNS